MISLRQYSGTQPYIDYLYTWCSSTFQELATLSEWSRLEAVNSVLDLEVVATSLEKCNKSYSWKKTLTDRQTDEVKEIKRRITFHYFTGSKTGAEDGQGEDAVIFRGKSLYESRRGRFNVPLSGGPPPVSLRSPLSLQGHLTGRLPTLLQLSPIP